MISKPSQKVMRAVANLRSNENFGVVIGFLEDCLYATDAETRSAHDEVKTRWLQGQAQDLAGLLSLIEQAKRM